MKFHFVAVLMVVSSAALATSKSLTLDDVFKNVTYSKPKCFGREFSKAELKANPKQTVTQIKAKLMKYSSDPKEMSAGLTIEVRLKGEDGMNYHNEFSCMDDHGQVLCAIDCDGGSVHVTAMDSATLDIKNAGFIIHGGCDDQSNAPSKILKPKTGADERFHLSALPASFCSDAIVTESDPQH